MHSVTLLQLVVFGHMRFSHDHRIKHEEKYSTWLLFSVGTYHQRLICCAQLAIKNILSQCPGKICQETGKYLKNKMLNLQYFVFSILSSVLYQVFNYYGAIFYTGQLPEIAISAIISLPNRRLVGRKINDNDNS